ncbi:hypothetical protein BKA58DRAFT_399958 [Alternaria rosae]|uniref:uncharacterized protein n=1 Tax=Alternaria rosae TaxID=1187941 RepID=UPI001E8CDCD6|nr:uncharacterized protein BKA58DRAFT_399958 [Alternaria rosae]KAH6875794.1 hypothetical protein BKA58DRAFT_399958 [Alternaria rosae]
MYRSTVGKERDTVEAASITVSQRQGPSKSKGGLDSIFDSFGPANDEFSCRRRHIHRADYNDDDYDDGWYEKGHPRWLDKYNMSTYHSGQYPCKAALRRQNSYPIPTRLAIEARRQSLYPYPHVPDRRSLHNDYEESPYLAPKDVTLGQPRRTGTTKSRYANSINPFSPSDPVDPFSPYADGASRRRLDAATARLRSSYREDDEWFSPFPRGGGVEARSRYGRRGRIRSRSWSRSQSRSRSCDRFYEREPVRRVHYADEPVNRVRPHFPSGDFDSYGADRVPGRTRRGRGQEHESVEEKLERLDKELETREEELLGQHRYK